MTWRGLARHMAVCVATALPVLLFAQTPVPPAPSPVRMRPDGFDLGQSSPNPTAGETRFPFFVGDPPVCRDTRRQYRVTLRVYNLLAQEVQWRSLPD